MNPKFTHMGMAAFKNPNNQYKAITIAQTLGDDASSEELAGRYGSAVQC
ncbi:choline-binding protein C, partial [Streptococcus pneumoniae]